MIRSHRASVIVKDMVYLPSRTCPSHVVKVVMCFEFRKIPIRIECFINALGYKGTIRFIHYHGGRLERGLSLLCFRVSDR